MARLPKINHRHKICVICEGNEDFGYFSRLKELSVWNDIYDFVPRNAHGASNIPSLYTSIFQNDSYEGVLIFCDTDKNPQREYKIIKDKLFMFHGGASKEKLSEKIIMFANPCTMQIILSHFGEVYLKNQGKQTNSTIIENLTGVKNYDAHEDQIRAICTKIIRKNYYEMKNRIRLINKPDTESASTNFIEFLDKFESDDAKWIMKIKSYLQKGKE